MKYFTRQWANGDVSDAEVQGAQDAYQRHVETLLPKLPAVVQQLAKNINLHDGLIRRVHHDRSAGTLKVALRGGDLQVGYFDIDLEYADLTMGSADVLRLRELACNPEAEVLYDEIDISPDGAYVHRILFWPDGEVEVVFRSLSTHVMPRTNREITREGFTTDGAAKPE